MLAWADVTQFQEVRSVSDKIYLVRAEPRCLPGRSCSEFPVSSSLYRTGFQTTWVSRSCVPAVSSGREEFKYGAVCPARALSKMGDEKGL